MNDFDWKLLTKPKGTVVSLFGEHRAVGKTGRLYRLRQGVYAMTTTALGGTDVDPAVAAILWGETEQVALRIYECVALPTGDELQRANPPPVDVVGFESLDLRTALSFEATKQARMLRLSATYNMQDGRWCITELRGLQRKYYFLEIDPGDDARIVGIQFRLA